MKKNLSADTGLDHHGWLMHRHFSVPCWFLEQNSIFNVFNDAQCRTRNRTHYQATKWVQVPWWGLQLCIHGADCLYFFVFSIIVFQNWLPLVDRPLKLTHLYKSQNIKRINFILFSYTQIYFEIEWSPSSSITSVPNGTFTLIQNKGNPPCGSLSLSLFLRTIRVMASRKIFENRTTNWFVFSPVCCTSSIKFQTVPWGALVLHKPQIALKCGCYSSAFLAAVVYCSRLCAVRHLFE